MNIAVVGLGLIGGSLLRALAAAGHTVLGYDADPATRATARTAAARAPAQARWQVVASVPAAAATVELVVVAVPLPAVGDVLDELADMGYAGLVTDVTSVKGPVRELVRDRLRSTHSGLAGFVGGHPMAGREVSGFDAADPALFAGCAWVLCLEPELTQLADWLALAALITSLGARVVPSTAEEHDAAVAAISHVPHLLASMLAVAADDPLAATLAAGSFRDATRVAAASPDLAAAMCGGNAAAVAPALDALREALDRVRALLDSTDPIAGLRAWFGPGHRARAGWPPVAGSTLDLPANSGALLRLGRVGGWITGVAPDRRTVAAVRPAV